MNVLLDCLEDVAITTMSPPAENRSDCNRLADRRGAICCSRTSVVVPRRKLNFIKYEGLPRFRRDFAILNQMLLASTRWNFNHPSLAAKKPEIRVASLREQNACMLFATTAAIDMFSADNQSKFEEPAYTQAFIDRFESIRSALSSAIIRVARIHADILTLDPAFKLAFIRCESPDCFCNGDPCVHYFESFEEELMFFTSVGSPMDLS